METAQEGVPSEPPQRDGAAHAEQHEETVDGGGTPRSPSAERHLENCSGSIVHTSLGGQRTPRPRTRMTIRQTRPAGH